MLRVVYVAVWMTVILMMHSVQCIDGKLTSDQIATIKKRSYNPWLVPKFNSLTVYDAGKVSARFSFQSVVYTGHLF